MRFVAEASAIAIADERPKASRCYFFFEKEVSAHPSDALLGHWCVEDAEGSELAQCAHEAVARLIAAALNRLEGAEDL